MVACAPDNVPRTAPLNVIGNPISTSRLETAMVPPAESRRKSAVKAEVWPVTIVVGDAICLSTIHGVKFTVPGALALAVLHGAALGPALHDHQLFVTLAVPAEASTFNPVEPPPVFPAKREKLTFKFPVKL